MKFGWQTLHGRKRTATKPILATSAVPEDSHRAGCTNRVCPQTWPERMGTRALAVLIGTAPTALAAPPPGVDLNSSTHAWFEAQHSATGAWCCSQADGHILDDSDWGQDNFGYWARINGAIQQIPDSALRDPKGGPNPTGHAIVWFTQGDWGVRVYCFAPGWEG